MTPDQAVALAFDEPVTPTSLCHDNEVRGMMTAIPVDAGLAIGNILWANAIGFQHSEKDV